MVDDRDLAHVNSGGRSVASVGLCLSLVLTGCSTERFLEFAGDSPSMRNIAAMGGGARQPVSVVSFGSVSTAQNFVALRLVPDTNVLLLTYPVGHPTTTVHTVQTDTNNKLLKACWLNTRSANWKTAATRYSNLGLLLPDAVPLEGQVQIRWKNTNNFRICTALSAPEKPDLIVKGEFFSRIRIEPAPCWVILYLLFHIPFSE